MRVCIIDTRVLTRLIAAVRMPAAVLQAQLAPVRLAPGPALTIGVEDRGPTYQLDRVYGAVRLPDGTIVVGNSATHVLRFYKGQHGQRIRTMYRYGAYDAPGEQRAVRLDAPSRETYRRRGAPAAPTPRRRPRCSQPCD